jgi:hypothetical protein
MATIPVRPHKNSLGICESDGSLSLSLSPLDLATPEPSRPSAPPSDDCVLLNPMSAGRLYFRRRSATGITSGRSLPPGERGRTGRVRELERVLSLGRASEYDTRRSDNLGRRSNTNGEGGCSAIHVDQERGLAVCILNIPIRRAAICPYSTPRVGPATGTRPEIFTAHVDEVSNAYAWHTTRGL